MIWIVVALSVVSVACLVVFCVAHDTTCTCSDCAPRPEGP